jgi:hypothetical protein
LYRTFEILNNEEEENLQNVESLLTLLMSISKSDSEEYIKKMINFEDHGLVKIITNLILRYSKRNVMNESILLINQMLCMILLNFSVFVPAKVLKEYEFEVLELCVKSNQKLTNFYSLILNEFYNKK